MIDKLNIKKLMIDTAPFIYFIEEHQKFLPAVQPIFSKIDDFEFDAFTSIITLIEVLVYPMREDDKSLENKYREILLNNANLFVATIDFAIAEKAAEIRANYNIKTPDAIQLACGIINQCDTFFTNDEQLKRVKEINVVCVNDLLKD